MTRRFRAFLADRRAAAQVPPGWDTEEGGEELRALVAATRAETGPVPVIPDEHEPRHAADGEAPARVHTPRHDGRQRPVAQDYRVPARYWETGAWRPVRPRPSTQETQ